MSTISIVVDPEIQAAFEQATDAERQALSQLISLFFNEGWADKNLLQVMDTISSRAEKRGLTPAILATLLADETEGS